MTCTVSASQKTNLVLQVASINEPNHRCDFTLNLSPVIFILVTPGDLSALDNKDS